MKQTLLEMVQDILNDMDSDEVNSITDTAESVQVAQMIRTTFFEMITRKEWPHLRKMTTLGNMSDTEHPNYLVLPEDAVKMTYLAYNSKREAVDRDTFRSITYLYPDEFVTHCNRRNTDNDNVESISDPDGIKLHIYNDRPPVYWTSFNDQYIVFDGWKKDLQSTLIGSDSHAELYFSADWIPEDTFVPNLPIEAFPGFLAEAKSVCMYKLKQMSDEKAEQQSKRQHIMLSQRGFITKGGVRYPNYGRRSSKMFRHDRPLFDKRSYTGGRD